MTVPQAAAYPESPAARSRWVLDRRGPKNILNPWKPYGFLWEEERGPHGSPISTATIFLTNRECPYRCVMCDLWKDTLDEQAPHGAIASQIRHALASLPPARQVKLYNAGSFFDPQAIPPGDYKEIAVAVGGMERVIVECHPKLIGRRTLEFARLIAGRLEVAIGLETAHSGVLEQLNKQFTLAAFHDAAESLMKADIDLRVFLLLRTPFMTEAEGVFWAKRSLDLSFDAGATACCVIPTRGGNGAMEALAASGDFTPPSLRSLEEVIDYGLSLKRGRVFSDLWGIERFAACDCFTQRVIRLSEMNRTQRIPESIGCALCEVRNGG